MLHNWFIETNASSISLNVNGSELSIQYLCYYLLTGSLPCRTWRPFPARPDQPPRSFTGCRRTSSTPTSISTSTRASEGSWVRHIATSISSGPTQSFSLKWRVDPSPTSSTLTPTTELSLFMRTSTTAQSWTNKGQLRQWVAGGNHPNGTPDTLCGKKINTNEFSFYLFSLFSTYTVVPRLWLLHHSMLRGFMLFG